MSPIYFLVFILFVFFIIWTWSSTKEFETPVVRVSYIFIGTIFITLLTVALFQISRIGVIYPNDEMIGEVQKIVLLIFVPINGFIVLTKCAGLFAQIKGDMLSKEDLKKKIRNYIIIFVIMIALECIYFKRIQFGIINIVNSR